MHTGFRRLPDSEISGTTEINLLTYEVMQITTMLKSKMNIFGYPEKLTSMIIVIYKTQKQMKYEYWTSEFLLGVEEINKDSILKKDLTFWDTENNDDRTLTYLKHNATKFSKFDERLTPPRRYDSFKEYISRTSKEKYKQETFTIKKGVREEKYKIEEIIIETFEQIYKHIRKKAINFSCILRGVLVFKLTHTMAGEYCNKFLTSSIYVTTVLDVLYANILVWCHKSVYKLFNGEF